MARRTKSGMPSTLLLTAAIVLLFALGACNSSGPKGNAAFATGQTTPVYSLYQQLFCLNILSTVSGNYISYSGKGITDSTIKDVDSVLSSPAIIQYIGTWKCVWGPVVYVPPINEAAANTMYMVQSQSDTTLYVIAIAGTNPASKWDWGFEDFMIDSLQSWDSIVANINGVNGPALGNGSQVAVSQGVYNGLSILMNMTDVHQTGSPSLYTFLTGLASSNRKMTIWTTGHSLGGALSPTLALYLNDTKANGWGKADSNITINCLAVAGFSPGDSLFSNYYSQKLGNNTTRVWNSMDAFPHGFNSLTLSQVYGLYATDTMTSTHQGMRLNPFDSSTLASVIGWSQNKTYTQLFPANDTMFTSGFYGPSNMMSSATANPDTFTQQMSCQHVAAYSHYFGIDSFQYGVTRILHLSTIFFNNGYIPAPILNKQNVPPPTAAK